MPRHTKSLLEKLNLVKHFGDILETDSKILMCRACMVPINPNRGKALVDQHFQTKNMNAQ